MCAHFKYLKIGKLIVDWAVENMNPKIAPYRK